MWKIDIIVWNDLVDRNIHMHLGKPGNHATLYHFRHAGRANQVSLFWRLSTLLWVIYVTNRGLRVLTTSFWLNIWFILSENELRIKKCLVLTKKRSSIYCTDELRKWREMSLPLNTTKGESKKVIFNTWIELMDLFLLACESIASRSLRWEALACNLGSK